MLKKKLNKAAFEALDEALQALYKKAEGSDNYLLQLEADDDDGAELKKAKDREKRRAETAEKALEKLREELDELKEQQAAQGDGALDKAGVEALKAKHAKELKAAQDVTATREAEINRILVEEKALALASDISTMPELLAEKLGKRMKVVYEDGKAVVKILDEAGEVLDDKKFEDLTAEFVANEKFAPIIIGSKASGGGAAGGSKKGGAQSKKLSEMSATEEAKFANEHPEQYEQMLAAEQG